MKKYQCDNCEQTKCESEFSDVTDVSMRFSPGDKYTDKECPECGSLAYPVETIVTVEELQDSANKLIDEIELLVSDHLKDDGLKFEDCSLVGIMQSTSELSSRITGIENSDMKGQPDTWLEAIFKHYKETQDGSFPPLFVAAISKSSWHEWQNGSEYSDLETEIKLEDCDHYASCNIHLVFDWQEESISFDFGNNLSDGFNEGEKIHFDYNDPDEMKSSITEAIDESWDDIKSNNSGYEKLSVDDVKSMALEIARILIRKPV